MLDSLSLIGARARAGCTYASDCRTNYCADDGTCQFCVANSECAFVEVCVNGYCVNLASKLKDDKTAVVSQGSEEVDMEVILVFEHYVSLT